MRLFSSLLILLLTLFCWPSAATAAKPRKSITIGYNISEESNLVEANGKRLSDYVKKKTSLEVKTFVAADYLTLVQALQSGKVDFAFFPPFSYVKAEENAGAKLLLKAVRRGRAVYYSAIIVHADSPIKTLDDLKGKNIAWVDRTKTSTTGYLIPRDELIRKKKVNPDAFFGKQTFLKSHSEVVKAVLEKTVDAAATWVNDTEGAKGAWHRTLRDKPEEIAHIRMIHVSDPIAGDALATTPQLWKNERPMVEKVTKVLQRMGEALDGQQILRDLYGIDKMVPAAHKDFDSVRSAAKNVGTK
jgi:phosphonate transport system substrate-binding protein